LIPIFLLIMGWGAQPERVQAGLYIIFYTIAGSFPLFFIILLFKFSVASFSISLFLSPFSSNLALFFIASAFLIKFPIYTVHLWLLKAHVEAPVAGSIILAGVLLKLGGYGLSRLLLILTPSVDVFTEALLVLTL